MTGCARSCAHRRMVTDYHLARHADEIAAEITTRGHATETREHAPMMITFKRWLQAHRGSNTSDEQVA